MGKIVGFWVMVIITTAFIGLALYGLGRFFFWLRDEFKKRGEDR